MLAHNKSLILSDLITCQFKGIQLFKCNIFYYYIFIFLASLNQNCLNN